MGNILPIEALQEMDMRFGCDRLIAVATCAGDIPYVRAVNAFYENGAFYFITHALSNKMTQLRENPNVAICGEWFTGHGVAENMGYILADKNIDLIDKLRTVFEEWYDNGHVNEADTNTIIIRIRLTDAVLFASGTKYELDFT